MTFYIDKKKNISPSSLALFFNNRQQFIKSYFENETFSNMYTERGTTVHKLIEDGFYTPQNVGEMSEKKIEVDISNIKKNLKIKAYFDTVSGYGGLEPVFTDYKTVSMSTKNNWNETKVFYDLKQKTYAYAL